jgi:hypothetical protein
MQSIVNRMTRFMLTVGTILILAAPAASAAEARPWLCRDKPVFSYSNGMRYEVTSGHGRVWKIFFMAFDAGGGHDGFEIVRSADLGSGGSASGSLEAGRYFAVAMYRQGGSWICPGFAEDSGHAPTGQLNNICYGEDGPPCLVNLAIVAVGAPH